MIPLFSDRACLFYLTWLDFDRTRSTRTLTWMNSFLAWHISRGGSPRTIYKTATPWRILRLLSSLDAMHVALDAYARGPDAETTNQDFLICCTTLYLHRLWDERPRQFSAEIMESSPPVRLALLLDTLQNDVLRTFTMYDVGRFAQLYGEIVAPTILPDFFKGHSFCLHITCGDANLPIGDLFASKEQNADEKPMFTKNSEQATIPGNARLKHVYSQDASSFV